MHLTICLLSDLLAQGQTKFLLTRDPSSFATIVCYSRHFYRTSFLETQFTCTYANCQYPQYRAKIGLKIPIKDDCQCWHTIDLICFSNDLEWHWLIDFIEFGISGQSHFGCQWHFPAFFFLSFCWKIYNIHFASSALEKWPKRAEEVSSLKDDSIWKHFHDKLEPNWVFIMETKTVYKNSAWFSGYLGQSGHLHY